MGKLIKEPGAQICYSENPLYAKIGHSYRLRHSRQTMNNSGTKVLKSSSRGRNLLLGWAGTGLQSTSGEFETQIDMPQPTAMALAFNKAGEVSDKLEAALTPEKKCRCQFSAPKIIHDKDCPKYTPESSDE